MTPPPKKVPQSDWERHVEAALSEKQGGGYFLAVVILLILAIAVVILVFLRHGIPLESQSTDSNKQYPWQKTCLAPCAEIVGSAGMDEIDASNCDALNLSKTIMLNAQEFNNLGNGGVPGNWHIPERLQALNDRIVFLHCRSQ